MGSFDHGLAGMVSLRAVNEWISVINSNLGGSNRTAFKATRVSFGGGVVDVKRDPRLALNGVQVPDSSMNVDHTRVDFSQGAIIQDGENTHLALQGDGFFAINDGAQTYYTRDGEFRWSILNGATILTTAGGLTVQGWNGTQGVAITRIGTGTTFAVDATTVTGASACVAIVRFENNQALKFSKYGATVFDGTLFLTANNGSLTAAAGADVPTIINSLGDTSMVQSALESSNAGLNDTLPELSLAQKLFSAVSKIINVHNTNLDTVVNLIR